MEQTPQHYKKSQCFYADMLEKVVLVCLFLWLLSRMWTSFESASWIINGLYVIDQILVLVFCLLRRPATKISLSLWDWTLAFGASFLPLLVKPATGSPLVPLPLAAVLMLVGVTLHLSAKLTLRRGFGVVAANRGIVLSGPYRLVRHPMYAGYFMTQLAILLAGPNTYNVCIVSMAWVLQVLRLHAEERFYSRDAAYAELCKRTRYRIIPYIY